VTDRICVGCKTRTGARECPICKAPTVMYNPAIHAKLLPPSVGRKKLGSVGVDSGQLVLVDPCYIDNPGIWDSGTYGKVCEVTLGDNRGGAVPPGFLVAFSTGYGDGAYDVWATYNKDGLIAKVEVIFIPDGEDDEE
jgi:hypothetical protein